MLISKSRAVIAYCYIVHGHISDFISDFPGSVFRKDAFFGRLEAEYELANHSVPSKVNDRLLIALEYYNDFIKYYQDSDLTSDANEIKEDIESRLTSTEKSS